MRFALSLVLFTSLSLAQDSATSTFSHQLWDSVLQRYVTDEGTVDYAGLKQNPDELVQYLELVERHSPDRDPELFPTEADRLAFWINAYNALIVGRVVENYPLKSIRDLAGFLGSVFDKTQTVGRKVLSYNDLEHSIIRKRFSEPRIHFVLNCASKSCAPLRRHALTAQNLESSLHEAAENFINDPSQVGIDPKTGTVWLSKYFDWFAEDFTGWVKQAEGTEHPHVLDYVRPYLTPSRRQLLSARKHWRVRFFHYDWSLNDKGNPK